MYVCKHEFWHDTFYVGSYYSYELLTILGSKLSTFHREYEHDLMDGIICG